MTLMPPPTPARMVAPFWTLDRVADAMRGDAATPFPRGTRGLGAVATDTRTIAAGDIFVALIGERFDAHDFLTEAVARGASAVVVSRREVGRGIGVPVLHVQDTLRALGSLARYRRQVWGRPVIAVGGSNGKTSTKELLRGALGSVLEVHATEGNLNNRIGVPLTLLALPDAADVAVVEVGTSLPGEVRELRSICLPDVAVLTSIGEEHLEWLGDVAGVLREESDIFDGVAVAITPAGQPEVAAAAQGRAVRVVSAGLIAGDVVPDRWGVESDGRGWFEIDGVVVRPPLRGEHNLRNAMLAYVAARECGLSPDAAAGGIARTRQPSMRSAWKDVGTVTIINDAYNASPASMRAALDMLARASATRSRVAVLGTMRELGPSSAALHDEIANRALALPIDLIGAVGEMADAFSRCGNPTRVVAAADTDALWPLLRARLTSDSIVLLKASRGVRLERLVPSLESWAAETG
ncbi:MAG: UDP-N-acetylmuramoyl-tripeptide--D-alanyl-D-alanine ligase [Gemmatimonadaceae bacterium]